jgi:asparagine synthase (glutamine-hydrolysing)
MCGICGLHSTRKSAALADAVADMNAALLHRGPDQTGQLDGDGCSLAMRRLSIIDLEGGCQPMHNEDGNLTIVFNGEIYNFQTLRRQLERSGRHVFRTQSDTEVLLHLFEEHGAATPSLLRGMFAFCIYDRRDDSLFLARDRFGEKPLYYSENGGAFGFSSELPSLLRWKELPRRLDYKALYYLLHFGYVPQPLTLFENIRQLPPGHSLAWRNQTATVVRYFTPIYRPDKALSDERVAVEALRGELMKAVASQMVCDVPLGAFLSGGIDSSTVVAAMQRQSSRPIQTFTVRFERQEYDESAIARTVARHLGTDHHEFVVRDEGFQPEDLWRVLRHFGQPFLDSSAIPTFLISQQIRRHATVALSGDGGDEVFAGYRYFSKTMAVDRLAHLPRPLLALGDGLVTTLSMLPWLRGKTPMRKAHRALRVASLPPDIRPAHMETLFHFEEIGDLITPALARKFCAFTDTFTAPTIAATGDVSRLRQLMHYWVAFRLPENMLAKVDRMSMATSLEVRCPLLSAEVSDLAMKLPDQHLIRGKTRKYLLREAGRKWLPDAVYRHPKMGFTIPLHTFMNQHYDELCGRYLGQRNQGLVGELFSKKAIEAIIARGKLQRSNAATSVHRTSHQLWALLQLSSWAECYNVDL